MDPSDVTLPAEEDWDHVLSLEVLVARADYGVLDTSTHIGRVVKLVDMDHPDATESTVQYTALQWRAEEGIHYDGDGTMRADHLMGLLTTEGTFATQDWSECESFLAE